MDLFPAIDLQNGQCVRLAQGDFNAATVYDADPLRMARRFAELSVSVAAIKQAHHRGLETDFASQLKYEADTQGWLQQQPDFAEATQAFAAKRPSRLAERTPPARTP